MVATGDSTVYRSRSLFHTNGKPPTKFKSKNPANLGTCLFLFLEPIARSCRLEGGGGGGRECAALLWFVGAVFEIF